MLTLDSYRDIHILRVTNDVGSWVHVGHGDVLFSLQMLVGLRWLLSWCRLLLLQEVGALL